MISGKELKEPFLVPDGYFANFTSQMMERLPSKCVHISEVVMEKPFQRYVSAAAVAILAMAFSSISLFYQNTTDRDGGVAKISIVGDAEQLYVQDEDVEDELVNGKDIYELLSADRY